MFGAKIVVIGGGTGSFVLLSGLRNYTNHLTALVSMADDGGSTGILRDEYGALPPGDIRQCLVALSDNPRIRDLFNYRFDHGSMAGHAFGNLFLTALENMTGSFASAVKLAEQVLRVNGSVVPITLDNIELVLRDGGESIVGELAIIEHRIPGKHPKLTLRCKNSSKAPRVNPEAIGAIINADVVVIAPGNIYGSLAPALMVRGVAKALSDTDAKIVYVPNLINKPGQTDNYSISDYADEIEYFIGKPVLDYVVYNTKQPSQALLKKYAADHELPTSIDKEALKDAHYKTVGTRLISDKIWSNGNKFDPLAYRRTLIRHDPDRVARAIMKIYFS